MGKFSVFLHVLTMVLFTSLVDSLTYCHAGSYYIPLKDGQHACGLCEPGTFMPHHDHQFTQCYDCMKIEDPMLEILMSECDGKDDAIIHCVSGYYRRLPSNPREKERCEKCTDCSQRTLHMVRECQTYTDTHCCMEENYMVAKNVDGVDVCHELPWICRRGQYFDVYSNECKPCPAGTFMSSDYHVMKECMKCLSTSEKDLPLHSVVLRQCNTTDQAVLACKDGFFIDHTKGHGKNYVGCSPCERCDDGMFEGRSCDQDHDTVCCPQPNMMVVDNLDGLPCQDVTTVSTKVESTAETPDVLHCPEGFCIYTNMNSLVMCVPCKDVDQFNNTDTVNTSDTIPEKMNGPTEQPEEISWSLVVLITLVIMVIIVSVMYKVPCINLAVRHYTARLTNITVRFYHHHSKRRYTHTDKKHEEVEDFGAEEPPDEIVVELSADSLISVTTPLLHNRERRDGKLYEGMRQRKHGSSPTPWAVGSTYRSNAMSQDHNAWTGQNTSDLQYFHSSCVQNKEHRGFIPAADFNLEHLPEGHRDNLVLQFIQTAIFLTVRVVVSYTSDKRPDDSEYAALRGSYMPKSGSGMVVSVSREFAEKKCGRCPCRECKKFPEKAKTQWGKFLVRTATRVVYDNAECEYIRCDVGYNQDEDRNICDKLDALKISDSDVDEDRCDFYCATHNLKVIKKMEEMVSRYEDLRGKLDDKYKKSSSVEMSKVPVFCISHPHGVSKHVSVGVMRGQQKVRPSAWSYTAQTCPGSAGAPVFALGKVDSDVLSGRHSIHSKSIQP